MSPRHTHRRNAINRRDRLLVRGVACAGAAIALTAGCSPTGSVVGDVFWTAAMVGSVVLAAASAPWWALLAMSFVAATMATADPIVLFVIALVPVIALAVMAARSSSAPTLRAMAAAVSINVMLRTEWQPFEKASALATGATALLVIVSGVSRRRRRERRLVVWIAGTVGALGAAALIGLAVAAALGRGAAVDGNDALVTGLEQLGDGQTGPASVSLHDAADHLDQASAAFDSAWATPARVFPILAQNRAGLADATDVAATAADAAATAVGLIDPEQLQVVGGTVDVDALALVGEPLSDLSGAVDELVTELTVDRSIWLAPSIAHRFEETGTTASTVGLQVQRAQRLVAAMPDLVGMSGERHYFLAFTNPAEARSQSGLMGNWSVITARDGRLSQTASGRTAALSNGLDAVAPLTLDLPADYLERFASAGAAMPPDGTVTGKYWSNVTMSADMPSVGSAMAQMYEASTGDTIDGVIVVDPTGVAAILQLTGPLDIDGLEEPLGPANATGFLTREQYQLPEGEREAVLEALTSAAMDAITSQVIASPVDIGDALGRPVLEGHISIWMHVRSEQALVEFMGADGSLPRLDSGDGLAVAIDNAAGNKIDSFLRTEVEYRPVFDPETGFVDAELVVTLHNDAPVTGYPDYVIGNLIDAPPGTNRSLVNVYTPLDLRAVDLDDESSTMALGREQGWHVYTAVVDLPAGSTRTLRVDLSGTIGLRRYRLVVRPPDLPERPSWSIEARDPNGRVLAGFLGSLEQRAVLDGAGLRDWRPAS